MKKNHIITVTFAVLLAGLSAFNALTPVKGFSESENRYLAKFPAFSRESILNGKFTQGFEEYATDQFFMRDRFIALHVLTERILGRQDSNGVYFGKDGYLLEKVETVEDGQLQKNSMALEAFFETLKAQGVSATAMIVPTAPFVLEDKLPAFAVQYDQGLIFDALGKSLGEKFVDTYPILSENKEAYIYYRTDHHWTADGAFLAYQALCEAWGLSIPLREDYPVEIVAEDFLGTMYSKVQLPNITADTMLRFVPDRNFRVTYNLTDTVESLYDQEALSLRDKYTYYLKGNNAITRIDTKVKNNRHLLVIKDSFAHTFVPFLTKDFETITMIDYRYYNASTKELLVAEGITDVLVLYNSVNFATEKSVGQIVK